MEELKYFQWLKFPQVSTTKIETLMNFWSQIKTSYTSILKSDKIYNL